MSRMIEMFKTVIIVGLAMMITIYHYDISRLRQAKAVEDYNITSIKLVTQAMYENALNKALIVSMTNGVITNEQELELSLIIQGEIDSMKQDLP